MKPRIRIRKLIESSNEPHEPNLTNNNPQNTPTLFRPITATLKKQPINPNDAPFDSSMALTVLALLIAFFFMGLFSIYIRRFAAAANSTSSSIDDLSRRGRRRRLNQNNYIGGPPPMRGGVSCPSKGVDPSTVRSLPVYYHQHHHHGDGEAKQVINDCLVCLSEFVEREEVKMIPSCRHVFHPYCIERWLSSHVSCPLCRTTRFFPAKDEDDVREVDVEKRSTVEIGDTWTSSSVRRTSSCSSLGEQRVSLQRTFSF